MSSCSRAEGVTANMLGFSLNGWQASDLIQLFGTHPLGRTKATLIRQFASRPTPARPHQDESTVRYLGIEVDDALSIAEADILCPINFNRLG